MSAAAWGWPGQLVTDPLDQRAVVDPFDLHLAVLPAPALELPLDVTLGAARRPEPHLVGVDVVQRGERVGHVVADGPPGRLAEGRLRLGAVRRIWPSTNSIT